MVMPWLSKSRYGAPKLLWWIEGCGVCSTPTHESSNANGHGKRMHVELSVKTCRNLVGPGRKPLLLVRVGGIHEYHTHHLDRIETRKHANVHAAQRMPNEHVGCGNGSSLQECV